MANSADVYATPLQQLIDMGGPVIVVLLVLALVGLIAFFYLLLTAAVFAPRLSRPLKKALASWQEKPTPDGLHQLDCQSSWLSRQNPLQAMMTTAMSGRLAQRSPDTLREALSRDARAALEPFDAPLKVLEVVAALAPLLGLLGTVLGMMASFSAMATSEGQASASQLSGGIYEALTTTAAGLVLAIPFAALAAWAEFRLRRLNSMVNATLVSVLTPELPEQSEESATTASERGDSANDQPQRSTPQPEPMTCETPFAHAAG
ncbi:MotA/TolQ/ExbB proton channel family protein [Marinobacter zhejiangensis]|uniref:Outer membrane transport energization protein ExbB n=1 Tax=Marinobacter zhejiangensis TaxID=488535 RepID=A0A1I4M1L3_9GAMM|nr:MotA/TolQ/ExbB proton channel family protein [Marinobacter zhejiangensis]SFL97094.1 outer membrane transport energization protein ExbB [Marinobacter zhejiangensis]